MNVTVPIDWYSANYRYLLTAVEQVRQVLERQVASRQNQLYEALPEGESALTAAAATMPVPPALEQLCTTFSLSPFERDVLLLCVGMEVIPNFKLLCADAQGDQQLIYPTFGLAKAVFPTFDWGAITPQAPLQHWQLIEIGDGQALIECPLRIDKRILYYLLGEPCLDRQLAGMVKPIQVGATGNISLQPSHQRLAEQLASVWLEPVDASTLPIVQLCGDDVAAKRSIAAAASALMGCNLGVMSASRLPSDPNHLNQLMRRWEREAILNNSILLLECDRINSADPVLDQAISQFIEESSTALLISSRDRQPPRQRPLLTLDIPKLTSSEQRAIWQDTLGTAALELNGQVEALVSQFNLSMPEINAACAGALGQVKVNKPEDSASPTDTNNIGTALWDICRTQARPHLDDLAQRIDSTATWEDLVLPEQQRQILRHIVVHVQQRAKVYQDWGFAGKGGRGLGISALFSGASGTGKTMAAEVIAKELRLDLYRIDLSAVVSKYIGETEKNLRRIFDAAETGGAILLFDEADALFGKRTEVKDSHDRHANVEVSYLLQRMEAYQGLAILTTNLKGSLDQAFLRRIRFVVSFPFPDATGRGEIWRRSFPHQTPTEGLDVHKLAKLNAAGGNIRNIALNAAFVAADAGEPVMMKHILQATRSEYVKLEKTLTDMEIRGWV